MDIITELKAGVFRLQMSRPEKKNALTHAMYSQMASALESADRDPAVRAILMHGHPEVFSSGNDLGDFQHSPPPRLSPGRSGTGPPAMRNSFTRPKPRKP
jgi:enoyl-CoA hydratase/carnithine racemase